MVIVKFLALEKEIENIPDDAFTAELLQKEAAQAWALYQSGILRELYFRDDRSEAVLVLECVDLKTAQETLATLPLVREGLICFDVFGLAPYPGWERLFCKST